MPAPELDCFGRYSFLNVDCRPEKRVRRSCFRTRFVLNLRQSRSGATGKRRRENGPRAADEEFAFPRHPELLRSTGLARAAHRGIAALESCEISRIDVAANPFSANSSSAARNTAAWVASESRTRSSTICMPPIAIYQSVNKFTQMRPTFQHPSRSKISRSKSHS